MLPLILSAMISSQSAFTVQQVDGVWWLVDPRGHRFQSVGVCCVNKGLTPDKFSEVNPGYGSYLFYKNDQQWAKDVTGRFKKWSFNTIGAWSDHKEFAESGLYQTPVLHLVAAGIPWVDMWDPAVVAKVDEVAKPQIEEFKKLPNVIGYFSDNELGWWIGALFEWAWKMKPEYEGREKLIATTKRLYPTWEDLLKDIDPQDAKNYEELSQKGRLYLKPGGSGMKLLRAWLEVLGDRYYALCRETIKRHAPDALFLGDRYISGYYPEVARQAGKYCDVVSTNLNADWPSGVFSPYYLDGLWSLAKKPIMITEYYACSMENRSGNMNDASGFPTLRTQKLRAASAQRQTLEILSRPYVVGAHWFQYYDEPTHGRDDGENYNMGLIDIDNRPYEVLVKTFKAPEKRVTLSEKGSHLPSVGPSSGPTLADWPQYEAARRRTEGDPRGDFFMAWNESGLYLALYWKESHFAEALYRDGKLPVADRPSIRIRIGDLPEIKVKVGERTAEVEGARLLKAETGVNNCIVLRVEARAFGVRAFAPGRTVSYEAQLDTQARAYHLRWTGSSTTQALP
jgi:hypothetical protein